LTFLVIGLPSAIAGGLLYLLCLEISKSKLKAFVATISIMLGTMCLPFSAIFFGHQLAAALLISSFFLIFQLKLKPDFISKPFYLFWVGILLGCAFMTEYTTMVVILPLVAYFLYILWAGRFYIKQISIIAAPILGGLVPVIILMIYNYLSFGSPFKIGYENLGNEFQASMAQGLMGINLPSLKVLFYLTFHPAQGIFWQSPVLLMGFVGIYYMLKDQQYRIEGVLIIFTTALYLLLNSGYFMWWGGASFGPRHLIPMLPFLAIPLVFVPRRLFPLVIVLGIVSIAQMFIPLAGFIQVPDDYFPNIGKLGFFAYSTIYSYCLPQLVKGYFAYNLGEKILDLKSWMILIPNLLALLITTGIFFLNEVIVFGKNHMSISK
jgi:4-amino-4-deoxy-L-arabinose transferase-like glycosyltransferase